MSLPASGQKQIDFKIKYDIKRLVPTDDFSRLIENGACGDKFELD